jgi:peptide-methionine (S)-S-oxide reductase
MLITPRCLLCLIALTAFVGSCARQPDQPVYAGATQSELTERTPDMATEFATFGAGCFWGVEAIYRKLPGVVDTAVGYMGGDVDNPTYKQVCTDRTGHAEVVHIEYDPTKVSYEQLLEVFWKCHDPTQVNRQGPDWGTQYRTVVFYHSEAQKQTAEASKQSLAQSGRYSRPIATLIEPAQTFWKAEEYHQQYLEKQGLENCHIPSE